MQSYDIYELMITPPNKKAEMILEEMYNTEPNLNLVKDLITLGANVHWMGTGNGNDEISLLHSCSTKKTLKIAKMLIDAGADVNASGMNGFTPLHFFSSSSRISAAKFFIKHGAKLDIRDDYNCTPLYYAVKCGYPRMAELLIDAGANVNVQDNLGLTPLHVCALTSNYDISPSDPKRFFILDDTNYISLEIAYILLEAGADVTIKDYSGKLPYNLTDNSDFLEILEP